MLAGCTPWPAAFASRYRARGWWQGITLWDMVAATIRRVPAHTALVAGDQRFTYAELGAAVEARAHGLVAAGIAPLERVVLQLPNGADFVFTYLALVRIGAIPVMALRAHRHAEVAHFLRASGAAAYVIPDVVRDFDYRAMAAELGRDARRCARCSWPACPDRASARSRRCPPRRRRRQPTSSACGPSPAKW